MLVAPSHHLLLPQLQQENCPTMPRLARHVENRARARPGSQCWLSLKLCGKICFRDLAGVQNMFHLYSPWSTMINTITAILQSHNFIFMILWTHHSSLCPRSIFLQSSLNLIHDKPHFCHHFIREGGQVWENDAEHRWHGVTWGMMGAPGLGHYK